MCLPGFLSDPPVDGSQLQSVWKGRAPLSSRLRGGGPTTSRNSSRCLFTSITGPGDFITALPACSPVSEEVLEQNARKAVTRPGTFVPRGKGSCRGGKATEPSGAGCGHRLGPSSSCTGASGPLVRACLRAAHPAHGRACTDWHRSGRAS